MALATLLGMNITHGLESRTPWLFMVVLAAGISVGYLVKRWVTR